VQIKEAVSKVGQIKHKRQERKTLYFSSYSLGRRESLRRAALSTRKITMTENNERPPYKRLVRSVTDGRKCLRSYSVLVEKSDLNCSTASLSLLECQRVSAPITRVAVNSRIRILDRFCISQDPLRRSLRLPIYFMPKSIDCQRSPPAAPAVFWFSVEEGARAD
jgi:hypothetical protein